MIAALLLFYHFENRPYLVTDGIKTWPPTGTKTGTAKILRFQDVFRLSLESFSALGIRVVAAVGVEPTTLRI
jgi:hypothetical protein